jgi:hypothetical protein
MWVVKNFKRAIKIKERVAKFIFKKPSIAHLNQGPFNKSFKNIYSGTYYGPPRWSQTEWRFDTIKGTVSRDFLPSVFSVSKHLSGLLGVS